MHRCASRQPENSDRQFRTKLSSLITIHTLCSHTNSRSLPYPTTFLIAQARRTLTHLKRLTGSWQCMLPKHNHWQEISHGLSTCRAISFKIYRTWMSRYKEVYYFMITIASAAIKSLNSFVFIVSLQRSTVVTGLIPRLREIYTTCYIPTSNKLQLYAHDFKFIDYMEYKF
jgi:hypothetical protein